MKRFLPLIPALLLTVLTPSLAGCKSVEPEPVFVYHVPDVEWPEFPAPLESSVWFDRESGNVVMTIDYFTLIYGYKVRVDECRSVLESMR